MLLAHLHPMEPFSSVSILLCSAQSAWGCAALRACHEYICLRKEVELSEDVVQDYDEKGDYIRTWVPELAKVPAPSLFEPWRLSREDQAKFGVQIGVSDLTIIWCSMHLALLCVPLHTVGLPGQ